MSLHMVGSGQALGTWPLVHRTVPPSVLLQSLHVELTGVKVAPGFTMNRKRNQSWDAG